jgi:hypothetical protein
VGLLLDKINQGNLTERDGSVLLTPLFSLDDP